MDSCLKNIIDAYIEKKYMSQYITIIKIDIGKPFHICSPIRLLIIPQSDPHGTHGHYSCLHGCRFVPTHETHNIVS